MALSLQFGFPVVPKSITNPNIQKKDALDVGHPMSFLTFIKIISDSYSPESLQSYYNFYIKEWNTLNNSKDVDERSLIVERYRDFLKDINLKYTTSEERKFLSNIDFNDPHDLDIALSFYSKKLKEIAAYYNNKREELKFSVVKNKVKGTNYGIKKSIKDLTISYLKNVEDSSTLFDINEIISKLDIQIDELYNTYSLYYNQTPDTTYDHKDLDYGYDIFLKSNEEVIKDVFSDLSSELLQLKEINNLLDNKRALTQDNVLTDFYYLSTGSTTTDFVSGKLFESPNNAINFSNRDYPTTVSKNVIDFYKTDAQLGFFKPSKISIVLVDGKNDSFYINQQNLEPNSLYYFPNPNILPKSNDILTFVVDTSFLRRNFSSGNARNHPKTTPLDTKYYGYVSKLDKNTPNYLSEIFDRGFVEDSKYDINGNLLGLFKNDHRLRQYIENIEQSTTYSTLINGHRFFDDLYWEGLTFNYTTLDEYTFNETKRTGLSSYTGGFSTINADLELNFGRFSPFFELKDPTDVNLVNNYRIIEGAYIANYQDIPYDDTISSDLSAFESSTDSFYYSKLIEGGIRNSTQRALLDPLYPTLSASFTNYSRTSALRIVEGGYFSDSESSISFTEPVYEYSDESVNNVTKLLSSVGGFNVDYLNNGFIYIKNSRTRNVLPLTEALSYLSTKYSNEVFDELENNVISFDVVLDTLFVETKSYLIVDKLELVGDEFTEPKIPSTVINKNSSAFEKISNRFRVKNKVFYMKTKNISFDDTYDIFYPEIYEFDVTNFTNTRLYPSNPNSLSANDSLKIPRGDFLFDSIQTPKLTYSSYPNKFAASFILKDQNHASDLLTYKFDITSDVNILDCVYNNSSVSRYTNIMDSLSNLTTYMSGGLITFEDNTLII